MKDKNYDRYDEDKEGKGKNKSPKSKSKGNKNKNKKKNKKNKENKQKTNQKPGSEDSQDGLGGDTNDVKWYYGNRKELYDALGVPTSFIPQGGLIFSITDADVTNTAVPGYRNFCEPGILTYDVVPVLPKDSNSGINQQIMEYYTKIYSVSTAANAFQPADLYQYMICLASAYTVYVSFARAYGSMMSYSALNLYSPKQIVTAMGFDYDSLSNDLPSFRFELTKLCNALRKFVVPKDITLFDRWIYLADNIFTDRDAKDPRAKLFMYRLTGYYAYGDGNAPSAIYTDFEFENAAVRHDLSWMRGVINQIINNLNSAESIQYMNALLLKAIGDTRFEIAAVGEDYQRIPLYDRAALLQAHNAIVHNELRDFREFDIDQDPGRNTIIQDIKGVTPFPDERAGNAALLRLDAAYSLVDIWDKDTVEKDDIMEATRFIPLINYEINEEGELDWEVQSCGSEIIRNARVWYYQMTPNGKEYTHDEYGIVTLDTPNLYNWTTFNHFPMINIGLATNPILVADHDVYAQLPHSELAKYHYVASFSQMDIDLPSGSGMLYK